VSIENEKNNENKAGGASLFRATQPVTTVAMARGVGVVWLGGGKAKGMWLPYKKRAVFFTRVAL
jgi:hypothetical protein